MGTWSRRWLEKARQRWRDKILGSRKSTVSNTVNCQDRGPPLSYLKKAYWKWARWWCWWKKNYDLIANFFTIRTGWTRSTEQDTKSSIVQCYRDTPFVWRDNRSLVWSLVRPSVRLCFDIYILFLSLLFHLSPTFKLRCGLLDDVTSLVTTFLLAHLLITCGPEVLQRPAKRTSPYRGSDPSASCGEKENVLPHRQSTQPVFISSTLSSMFLSLSL